MSNELIIAIVAGVVSIGGAWIAARSQHKQSEGNLEKIQDDISQALWLQIQGELSRLRDRITILETENDTLRRQLGVMDLQIQHLERENSELKAQLK